MLCGEVLTDFKKIKVSARYKPAFHFSSDRKAKKQSKAKHNGGGQSDFQGIDFDQGEWQESFF